MRPASTNKCDFCGAPVEQLKIESANEDVRQFRFLILRDIANLYLYWERHAPAEVVTEALKTVAEYTKARFSADGLEQRK